MAYRTDYLPGVRPTIPQDGLAGLRENWRADLRAGLITVLVSLPLSMGIALASGAPALSGAISLLVGGMVVALVNGSFVTINAPAPGLIVVMYQIAATLGQGDPAAGYSAALAVTVVAGVLLVLASLVNAGRLAQLFPPSTVEGMMSAVGLIVVAKELYYLFGILPQGATPLAQLTAFPGAVGQASGPLALLGLVSLAGMALPRVSRHRWLRQVPGPILAVALGIGVGFWVPLPDAWRVHVPDRFWEHLSHPDFSQLASQAFLTAVVTLTLIQGIETMLSAAAVDRLDPYRRRSNLNRDMAAVGFGSALAGLFGGQPLIASLIGGATNVQAGARTRWANFFQGVFAMALIALLPWGIQLLPRPTLSAILLVIGLSLLHPRFFREFYRQGWDQLAVYLTTFALCVTTDLLMGVLAGLLLRVLLHIVRGASWRTVFTHVMDIAPEADGETVYVHFRHSAALSNEADLRRRLGTIAPNRLVIVDFTDANLGEASVVEQLRRIGAEYAQTGGRFEFVGLPGDTSEHVLPTDPLPAEIAVHPIPATPSGFHRRELSRLAVSLGADFLPHKYAAHARFVGYPSFEEKLVKYAENTLQGPLPCAPSSLRYVIKDLTVAEYLGIAAQEFQLTVWLADGLPEPIPHFTLRSESLMTRVADYVGFADINFAEYPTFSNRYLLRGREVDAIRAFFTPGLLEYLERQTVDFRLESNGRGLLLYLDERLLNPDEIRDLHAIGCGFLQFVVAPSPPA